MEQETKKYLVMYALIVDGTPTGRKSADLAVGNINTDTHVGIQVEKGKFDAFKVTNPIEILDGNVSFDQAKVDVAIEALTLCLRNKVQVEAALEALKDTMYRDLKSRGVQTVEVSEVPR